MRAGHLGRATPTSTTTAAWPTASARCARRSATAATTRASCRRCPSAASGSWRRSASRPTPERRLMVRRLAASEPAAPAAPLPADLGASGDRWRRRGSVAQRDGGGRGAGARSGCAPTRRRARRSWPCRSSTTKPAIRASTPSSLASPTWSCRGSPNLAPDRVGVIGNAAPLRQPRNIRNLEDARRVGGRRLHRARPAAARRTTGCGSSCTSSGCATRCTCRRNGSSAARRRRRARRRRGAGGRACRPAPTLVGSATP